MIPRTVARQADHRSEERVAAASETAVLNFRGQTHVVRLVNTSRSGAMVLFPQVPHIGEQVSLKLLDSRAVLAHVLWVRNGRVGVRFDGPLE